MSMILTISSQLQSLLISIIDYNDKFINLIISNMIKPKLKGKQVKDYTFGDALCVFQQGSQVAHAVKAGKMKLTVYAIANTLIDANTFPIYNNQIVQNANRIYPAYYQIVRSQNFLYMIFEQLTKPHVDSESAEPIKKFIYQLQKLLNSVSHKISTDHVFMKTNGSCQLCIIIPYSKNLQKTSNLYSKYHNKSVIAQLFCQVVRTKNDQKVSEILIDGIQNQNVFDRLIPYLQVKNNIQNEHIIQNKIGKINEKPKQFSNHTIYQPQQIKPAKGNHGDLMKSNANMLIKQVEQEYPQIDEKQYEELMAYVHVNPNLKQEAGQAYMRQSVQARKQQAQKQISDIVNNVNTSLFNVSTKKFKDGKSKVQIKLNKKKVQINQFQIHFEALYSTFVLFKDTIRSYLSKYKNGFAGIIAAYLLTLIGILRRLRLYNDLAVGMDIFEIGGEVQRMNFQKYLNFIRKDLAKQARTLVNLKNIIENANMPYKTYEALMPFLQQDLQSVDLEEAQKFCFFYMTILIRMGKQRPNYHELQVLQVIYILINPIYSIVYSEQDTPKSWDSTHYEMKKVLISALVPQWSL